MYAAFLTEWAHNDVGSTASLEDNVNNDSPSAHFAEEFDLLCSLSKWPSAIYQLLSEYANTLSLSDAAVLQLLVMVPIL